MIYDLMIYDLLNYLDIWTFNYSAYRDFLYVCPSVVKQIRAVVCQHTKSKKKMQNPEAKN